MRRAHHLFMPGHPGAISPPRFEKKSELYTMCKGFLSILGFILLSLFVSPAGMAQPGAHDTLLMGGVVVGADTFPMTWLPDHFVIDKLPRKYRRAQRRYDRLRH